MPTTKVIQLSDHQRRQPKPTSQFSANQDKIRKLLAAVQPAQKITATTLITKALVHRADDPRSLTDIILSLPALLHVVLQIFLDKFDYATDIQTDQAEACRILAQLISSLEVCDKKGTV